MRQQKSEGAVGFFGGGMNQSVNDQQWSKVIAADKGWIDIRLGELWRYRDLIMLFVRRDFVAIYKQTILGPFWFLLQPIVSTIVFTIIFGQIAKIPTDGIPNVLFYMSGIVAWNYFSSCLNGTSNTFIANAGIFGKVYFPRLAVPVSVVLINLLTFAIQFSLLLACVLYFSSKSASIKLTPYAFLIPLLVIQMAALGLGLGILVSALTTRYRDLAFALGFGMQLWMYATPIVYPLSQVPAHLYPIVAANPMSAIIEAFRFALVGAGSFSGLSLLISLLETIVILFFGIIVFTRVEKNFMDTV